MSDDKFCLKWNDFESNISRSFKELREEKDLFDVWLSCDNGQMELPAHKLILSACSSVLKHLLRRKSGSGGCSSHVLYLRGVQSQDLEYILSFMYNGEVSLAQDQLNSFLAVAEDLQIKGLTQKKTSSSNKSDYNVSKTNNSKLVKSVPNSSTVHNFDNDLDDDIQEINPDPLIKHEPYPSTQSSVIGDKDNQLIGYHTEEDYMGYDEENYVENTYQDQELTAGSKVWDPTDSKSLDALYQRNMEGDFICIHCSYTNKFKQNMQKHVETHLDGPGHMCRFCYKTFKTRNSVQTHISTYHRDERK